MGHMAVQQILFGKLFWMNNGSTIVTASSNTSTNITRSRRSDGSHGTHAPLCHSARAISTLTTALHGPLELFHHSLATAAAIIAPAAIALAWSGHCNVLAVAAISRSWCDRSDNVSWPGTPDLTRRTLPPLAPPPLPPANFCNGGHRPASLPVAAHVLY
jgi:hypothetical protein